MQYICPFFFQPRSFRCVFISPLFYVLIEGGRVYEQEVTSSPLPLESEARAERGPLARNARAELRARSADFTLYRQLITAAATTSFGGEGRKTAAKSIYRPQFINGHGPFLARFANSDLRGPFLLYST